MPIAAARPDNNFVMGAMGVALSRHRDVRAGVLIECTSQYLLEQALVFVQPLLLRWIGRSRSGMRFER